MLLHPTRRSATSIVALFVTVLIVITASAADAQNYRRASGDSGSGAAEVRPQAPVPAPPMGENEILVPVGADAVAIMKAHPAGTHYRIAEGTHRALTLPVETGDVVTGDDGAVLDGAIVLPPTDFVAQANRWVAANRTEEVFAPGGNLHGEMEEGHEAEAANHDLWIDGRRARHVNTAAEVAGSGTWHFDYATRRITIAANPADHLVELSVAWTAVDSGADDVTVQFLTVRRYASPAQHGAIQARGRGWTLAHLTVEDNHGAGIVLSDGTSLSHSRILRNGQLGLTAWSGDDIVVTANEIADNRVLGYNWGWEGGATKFKETTDMVFTGNWVHGNDGPGVWFDIDNRDAVIAGNVIEDNHWGGVLIEISYGAVVRDNTIRDNGASAFGDLGAGVWVSNSSGVEITQNLMQRNRFEILATHDSRGEGRFGPYETTALDVHDNEIEISQFALGLRVRNGEDHRYSDPTIRFHRNVYHLTTANHAFWWDGDQTTDTWKALGFDTDSTFRSEPAEDELPAAFASSTYGHAA